MTHDNIHTCSYECERPACIKSQRDELAKKLFELVAEAVAAEREACAKVCESLLTDGEIYRANFVLKTCAKTIRTRGE